MFFLGLYAQERLVRNQETQGAVLIQYSVLSEERQKRQRKAVSPPSLWLFTIYEKFGKFRSEISVCE